MKIFEVLIGKLKKEKEYKFEQTYNNYDLLHIIYYRYNQILRGFISSFTLKNKGLIFKGKNVQLLYRKYICIGKSCILEDDVYINALSKYGVIFGDNVTIAKGARLICTGVIRNIGTGIIIGSGSAIGSNNFIGGQGGVEIGENVIIGPDVKIFSENHIINKDDKPIKLQGEERNGVKINNNCWIGAGSIILDGVTLPEGTVVAAGSVITKSFDEMDSVIGGIPAKIIKSRFQ